MFIILPSAINLMSGIQLERNFWRGRKETFNLIQLILCNGIIGDISKILFFYRNLSRVVYLFTTRFTHLKKA